MIGSPDLDSNVSKDIRYTVYTIDYLQAPLVKNLARR